MLSSGEACPPGSLTQFAFPSVNWHSSPAATHRPSPATAVTSAYSRPSSPAPCPCPAPLGGTCLTHHCALLYTREQGRLSPSPPTPGPLPPHPVPPSPSSPERGLLGPAGVGLQVGRIPVQPPSYLLPLKTAEKVVPSDPPLNSYHSCFLCFKFSLFPLEVREKTPHATVSRGSQAPLCTPEAAAALATRPERDLALSHAPCKKNQNQKNENLPQVTGFDL